MMLRQNLPFCSHIQIHYYFLVFFELQTFYVENERPRQSYHCHWNKSKITLVPYLSIEIGLFSRYICFLYGYHPTYQLLLKALPVSQHKRHHGIHIFVSNLQTT